MTLEYLELRLCGDVYLAHFKCLKCGELVFEDARRPRHQECGSDFSELPIKLPDRKNIVLVSGSKRKHKSIIPTRVIRSLLESQCRSCAYCLENFTADNFEVEHVVPVYIGGTNDPSNLVLACAECNGIAGKKCFLNFEAKRNFILRIKNQ